MEGDTVPFSLPPEGGKAVKHAVDVLRAGGVVAFPTETSYGLGASVDEPAALERIYKIKKRPAEKPLLVIVDCLERMAGLISEIPPAGKDLIERFWPGPLTILLPATPGLPRPLHCGTGKVGIRISDNPWALALAERLGRPVTATSANLSGYDPAASAREVREQLLSPAPDYILDGGRLVQGQCSTIVDVSVRDASGGWGAVRTVRRGVIDPAEILQTGNFNE